MTDLAPTRGFEMKALLVGLGILVGVVGFVGFRLAFAQPVPPPHHHASFAIFVDGARVDLSGDEFMEDVSSCAAGHSVLPRARVHLHDNNPDIVHVHHGGVTWGHLFANLGIGVGRRFIAVSEDAVLTEGEGRTMKFILNGRTQFSVVNEPIRSGDRVLVSFGPEGEAEVLRSQFPQVATGAEEYDTRDDPAGCAGAGHRSFRERIRHALVG